MSKTFVAAVLVVLSLSPAGKAVAGAPDGRPGKMVFDRVGDELRKYRNEKDEEKRGQWMAKLARTHDPRVAVALGETMTNPNESRKVRKLATGGLIRYYVPLRERDDERFDIWEWWERNEASLRRRAAQLPW